MVRQRLQRTVPLAVATLVAWCTGGEAAERRDAPDAAAQEVPACRPMVDRMPLEGRASPYDSLVVDLGGARAKICYGRPSLRGRDMLGSMRVPYDTLWRTGANEPTTLHIPVEAEIAGIHVVPGSYSLYTVPRPAGEPWTLIVNASTSQWGHEGAYTPRVRAQEVGRAEVPSGATDAPIEQLTLRVEPVTDDATAVILEWEDTRIRFRIRRTP